MISGIIKDKASVIAEPKAEADNTNTETLIISNVPKT